MTPPPSDAAPFCNTELDAMRELGLRGGATAERYRWLATVDALRAQQQPLRDEVTRLLQVEVRLIQTVRAADQDWYSKLTAADEERDAARARIAELTDALSDFLARIETHRQQDCYGITPRDCLDDIYEAGDQARKALAPAAEPESLREKGG